MMIFTRLAGAQGADVHDVDLSQPLRPADVDLIRLGLLEHQVLFFREQPLLTKEQHLTLGRCFGELESNPFQPEGADPTLLTLDQMDGRYSDGANFHADSTFRPSPPMGALLQAHILPDRGGDTCFSSMTSAYDALSPRMQAFLDGLEAWHSLAQMAAPMADQGGSMLRLDLAEFAPVKHPAIARHPDTGRKLINVNYNWTTHIDGLPTIESKTILEFLYDHIRNPEFQVRRRWQPGDIAFWDNRVTQHYPVPDYLGRRLMQRVAIAGTSPRDWRRIPRRAPDRSWRQAISIPI